MTNHGPHYWTQSSPYIPDWIQQTPFTPMYTPQSQPITPNPSFPLSATLPTCTPIEIRQTSPSTIIVTVSIPTETIFTLPTKALEIKRIKKNLKITQCHIFNFVSPVPDIPHDTPKLFLGGFVRKDIQYSEAVRQTPTTVEGTIKDFVINIPISCVVDLGRTLVIPTTIFSSQAEYEYLSSKPFSSGFAPEDKLMSGDFTEFNVVNQQFLNLLPNCELIFTQINEINKIFDRIPLQGGPLEEGVFKTLQEKMIILVQLRLTFQP